MVSSLLDQDPPVVTDDKRVVPPTHKVVVPATIGTVGAELIVNVISESVKSVSTDDPPTLTKL